MIRMAFNSPSLVEFVGQLGFDLIMMDCEHTSASVTCVEEMVRAARAVGATAIVRPERLEDATITRYLDCKAHGVMVPHIEDAESATRLRDIIRYARPHSYEDLLTIAMIESREAVENLDSILEVDGVDVFFLARVDLSKSLGFGGVKDHPEVKATIDRAIDKIRAKGKIAGAAGGLNNVDAVIQQGVGLVFISIEDLLREVGQTYLARAGKSVKASGGGSY